MSVWERMNKLDARCIYLLLVVVITLPLLKPWNLPISISPETRAYFDMVKSVQPGKFIGIAADYRSDTLTELNPILASTFRQAMLNGNRVILWALIDEGPTYLRLSWARYRTNSGRHMELIDQSRV